ncbi:MAG: hypothetical protein H0W89_04465 [Candidatus Levybacteria bacterium]|nr:hypothetical protein [Candidatus Levybacteria bacterium]
MANAEKLQKRQDKLAAREARRESRNEAVRHGISRYIHNFNPKDKDAMWWTGAVVSAGLTGLTVATGGGSAWAKTAFVGGVSGGFYAAEKGIYTLRKKHIEKKYNDTELATKMKNLQTRHENGALRVQRLLMGVSAGAVYGGATGAAVEAGNAIINKSFELRFPTANEVKKGFEDLGNTPLKNIVTEPYGVAVDGINTVHELLTENLYEDVLTPIGHGFRDAWESEFVQSKIHTLVEFGNQVKDVAVDVTTNDFNTPEGVKRVADPVVTAIGGAAVTLFAADQVRRRNRRKTRRQTA